MYGIVFHSIGHSPLSAHSQEKMRRFFSFKSAMRRACCSLTTTPVTVFAKIDTIKTFRAMHETETDPQRRLALEVQSFDLFSAIQEAEVATLGFSSVASLIHNSSYFAPFWKTSPPLEEKLALVFGSPTSEGTGTHPSQPLDGECPVETATTALEYIAPDRSIFERRVGSVPRRKVNALRPDILDEVLE
jgi:hypothetical protein